MNATEEDLMTRRYICTIDPDTAERRRPQGAELRRRLLEGTRLDDGLRLRFEDGTEELVEEFVRDEKECCAFFTFDVRLQDDAVVLEMRAPADDEAQRMVDAALATFLDGETSGATARF